MVLTTAYFPPIEYFAILAKYSLVYIEAHENYQKQSYRNRCHFYADNGMQSLNVPVVHENGTFSLPIRDIKVDYSTPWMLRTKRAIESAYSSSPFFEYYRDELFAILDRKPEKLWDLNASIMDFFIKKIGLRTEMVPTEEFLIETDEDLRFAIHPKKASQYIAKPYYQVFSDRNGFLGNLSVMDLLFNEGPESICYL